MILSLPGIKGNEQWIYRTYGDVRVPWKLAVIICVSYFCNSDYLYGATSPNCFSNSICNICITVYRRNKDLIKELSQPAPGSTDLYFPTKYSQSCFTQCVACIWKQNMSYWRNPPYNTARFIFTTVTALIFGTMFWNLGRKIQVQVMIYFFVVHSE